MGCAASTSLRQELERGKGELERSNGELASMPALEQLNPEGLARVKTESAQLTAEMTLAAAGLLPCLMDAATFHAEIAALQAAGDLAVLITGARVHLTDVGLQVVTMQVVRALLSGANSPKRGRIFALISLSLLLDVLDAHEMERVVVETACGAICNLTERSFRAEIAALQAAGDLTMLLAGARVHLAAVQVAVMRAVREILRGANNPNRDKVYALGSLLLLLDVLDAHEMERAVVETACGVM